MATFPQIAKLQYSDNPWSAVGQRLRARAALPEEDFQNFVAVDDFL